MADEFDTLEDKIRAARPHDDAAAKEAEIQRNAENMSVGMRAGAELTGAIGGAAFIGWALDRWLDTAPIFLISLLLLGVFTGFFNVYRLTQNSGVSGGFSGLQTRAKTIKNAPDDEESD